MEQQNSIQKNNKKLFTKGAVRVGAFDGIAEFAIRRYTNPEESMLKSAAMAAGTAAAWMVAPAVMWGVTGIQLANTAGEAMGQFKKDHYDKQIQGGRGVANFGGQFMDTEMGYTMRQRGMQAISQSRMNARSALMNEARSLHRL